MSTTLTPLTSSETARKQEEILQLYGVNVSARRAAGQVARQALSQMSFSQARARMAALEVVDFAMAAAGHVAWGCGTGCGTDCNH